MGVLNRARTPSDHVEAGRIETGRQLAVLEAHAEPRISGTRITQAWIGGRGFRSGGRWLSLKRFWLKHG